MHYLFRSLFVSLFLFSSGISLSQTDQVINVASDNAEMNTAIGNAKKSVKVFIDSLSDATVELQSVKVPIEDDGQVEHFWLTGVEYKNGKFHGTINNDPQLVKNVRIGQKYVVDKKNISDWMYMKNEKIYGNYTLRVLLDEMPKEEADAYRQILADLEE